MLSGELRTNEALEAWNGSLKKTRVEKAPSPTQAHQKFHR